MLWDDNYLYIAAELEEPNVTGTLTKHDSVIFKDNDFEVFIKPLPETESYYEFEMNALNTGWDLFLPKPYSQGGKADNSWDIAGLKTAVAVQGTLNHPSDTDHGWTLEIAYPLSIQLAPAGAAAQRRDGVAHQLQPRGVDARQSEGRQLGLVAAGRHQHARARPLGLPALPLASDPATRGTVTQVGLQRRGPICFFLVAHRGRLGFSHTITTLHAAVGGCFTYREFLGCCLLHRAVGAGAHAHVRVHRI